MGSATQQPGPRRAATIARTRLSILGVCLSRHERPVLQKKRALRDSVICLNLNAYASLPSQVSIHRGLQPLHVSSLNAVSTCVSSLKLLSQRVVLRRESGGVYLARGPSRPSRVEVYRYRTD
jgi:hypothetical protein